MPIGGDHSDLVELADEASSEDFVFVWRLIADWTSGANRFDRLGERLLGAVSEGRLIGVCGINRDPYVDRDAVARLRHLYVKSTARRAGIGGALVRELLHGAEAAFAEVRLRTDTRDAAAFYEKLGFAAVDDGSATHVKLLRPDHRRS